MGGRRGAPWKAVGHPRALTRGGLAQTHGHGRPQDVHTDVHSSGGRCTPGERPQLTVEERTGLSVPSRHSHGSLKPW